jgi:hypothetical protein
MRICSSLSLSLSHTHTQNWRYQHTQNQPYIINDDSHTIVHVSWEKISDMSPVYVLIIVAAWLLLLYACRCLKQRHVFRANIARDRSSTALNEKSCCVFLIRIVLIISWLHVYKNKYLWLYATYASNDTIYIPFLGEPYFCCICMVTRSILNCILF